MMMGVLLHRQGALPFRKASSTTQAEAIGRPLDVWMGVLLPDGVQVGFVNLRRAPAIREGRLGASLALHSRFRFAFLGEDIDVHLTGSAWTCKEGEIRDVVLRLRSGGHVSHLSGEIEGGVLTGILDTGGHSSSISLPLGRAAALDGFIGLGIGEELPAPGESVFIDGLDPYSLSPGRVRLTCLAMETLDMGGGPVATHVFEVGGRGSSTKLWLDDSREIVRLETPFGIVLQKMSVDEALKYSASESRGDLLAVAAVRPRGKKPFRGARRMIVEVLNSESGLPSDDTQQDLGDRRYVIAAPDGAGSETPARNEDLTEHLADDPFIQTENPVIQRLAADIVNNEERAWAKAGLICQWVYENIRKQPVVSVPSAMETLETREGDCNEHTVLYAALARAAGVPARVAVGLVWSDELEGFYYHAWPEVYVGRWIWVDPTLGQRVADATHIKLLTGGVERWAGLVFSIGRLKLNVLEVE